MTHVCFQKLQRLWFYFPQFRKHFKDHGNFKKVPFGCNYSLNKDCPVKKQRSFKRPSTRKRSFAKTQMFWIVLTDGSWKKKRGGKSENTALPFSCGRQIRILSKTMTPSPHPSTSEPTSGGLHARVHAAEDIGPFLQLNRLVVECESQQRFDRITGPDKRFWFPCTSHIHLLHVVFGFSVYCLFVYRAQALCARSVSSSLFLVNFKRHL